MSRLVYVCDRDSDDGPTDGHETSILIRRCSLCQAFALAGYRCECGYVDTDPIDAMQGHGRGECVDAAG